MLKLCVIVKFMLLFVLTMGNAFANNATGFEDEQFQIDERAAIQRASAAWAQSINDLEPLKSAALYANQISVSATFKTQIDNYKDLLAYFTMLSKKQSFNVLFNEENIRVYGPAAVNSGVYTFSYVENDKKVEIPARFTFVYVLTPSGWKIVEHHSSVLPE